MIKQSSKKIILEELLKNLNECVSGQGLADHLGISRTAVNTHISRLISEEFPIEKIHGHGYRLTEIPDSIFEPVLWHFLKSSDVDINLIYQPKVTSTNTIAKSIADDIETTLTVIVSDEQTDGRGRLGRTWHSENKAGLMMSIIIKPELLVRDAGKITLLTALAVNLSLHQVSQIKDLKIKWPNDILTSDNKKLCGILTEISADIDGINWVVVGIGVNVNHPKNGYPDDIVSSATSIEQIAGKRILRAKLLSRIVENFYNYINRWQQEGFNVLMDEYREYMAYINENVVISTHKYRQYGKLVGINDEGELIILCDGEYKNIVSGEVSLRLNKDGVK